MSFECKFCKKNYSTKSILTNHQKTAKHCIKIQQSVLEDNCVNEVKYKLFKCKYCNKTFSSNYNLNKHVKLCICYYKNLLLEKDSKNEQLEKKILYLEERLKTIELETENRILRQYSQDNQSTIHEIAKQPRIQQNNNNQKILITSPMDLTPENIKSIIDNNFSADYMIQGQKGIARFAYDNMLHDNDGSLKYICTDASRQIFQYKNGDGEVQKDVRAKKLTKALLDGELKSISHKIASDKMVDGDSDDFLEYSTYFLDIKELENNNNNFSKELSTLVS